QLACLAAHRSGVSLSRIAEATGLSRQRVHQLVNGALRLEAERRLAGLDGQGFTTAGSGDGVARRVVNGSGRTMSKKWKLASVAAAVLAAVGTSVLFGAFRSHS